ncbi:hypothetical protein HDV00_012003 [Rhizophlyctis rosea]|nr:hypothetical protein HDV00_012003 [Rhizophlyctis rosea]
MSGTPIGLQTPSKKRCRDYVVEEDIQAERAKKVAGRPDDMDLDEEDKPVARWRSFNDLTPREVAIARIISAERLSQALYLDPAVPKDSGDSDPSPSFGSLVQSPSPSPRRGTPFENYSAAYEANSSPAMNTDFDAFAPTALPMAAQLSAFSREGSNPFLFGTATPTRPPTFDTFLYADVGKLRIPERIHIVAQYIANYGQGVPGVFAKQGDVDRLAELRELVKNLSVDDFYEILSPGDSVELAVLMGEYIRDLKGLLGRENLDVWRTILSNNQAQEQAPILSGAYIKEPSDTQIKFLRNALLLLPTPNRHLLQYLITFCATVARPTSTKTPAAAARNLASIFGPALTATSTTPPPSTSSSSIIKRPDWSVALFELLIHAHGLHYGRSVDRLKKANEEREGAALGGMCGESAAEEDFWKKESRLFMVSTSFCEEVMERGAEERRRDSVRDSVRKTPGGVRGRRVGIGGGMGVGIGGKASAKKLFAHCKLMYSVFWITLRINCLDKSNRPSVPPAPKFNSFYPTSLTPSTPTSKLNSIIEPISPRNYVSLDQGMRGSLAVEANLDRERFSKRRRVEF